MTLQTSGPISMGQAIAECQNDGSPYGNVTSHAADYSLSKLAGVNPGDPYKWSDWYGKSLIPVYNGLMIGSMNVTADRYVYVSINISTGAYTWSQNSSDNGSGLQSISLTNLPLSYLQYYKTLNAYVTYASGSTRIITTVSRQPSASNGYSLQITFNDDPYSGAANASYYVYLNASPT